MKDKRIVFILCMNIIEIFAIVFFVIFAVKNRYTISYEDYFMGVVEIKIETTDGKNGYATGFKIENGILTNKHVIQKNNNYYKSIEYRNANEIGYNVINKENIIVDDSSDLAFINMETNNCLKLTDSFKLGDSIFTIGNPNGCGLGLSFGYVSAYNYSENFEMNVIRLDCSLNNGNSGGPVINKNGCVIGIVSFKINDLQGNALDGIAYAIPSNEIMRFLQKCFRA